MRILMLIDSYPPMIGGAQQYVRNLSVALAARGHSVAVATLAGGAGAPGSEPAAFEEDHGVRVYRLRGTLQRATRVFRDRTYAPPVPDPELVRGIRDVIRREKPDVVHAHNWMGRSFLPLKAWSGAKFVVSVHDYSLRCAAWILMRDGEPCTGPGLRKCLPCAAQHYDGRAKGAAVTLGNWAMAVPERALVDMFVPVSAAVANGNGIPAGNRPYRVIPNFIPDDLGELPGGELPGGEFPGGELPSDQDYRAQLPPDGYLLFVGSLTRQKGIETLLAAYAGLSGAPPLVLVGYTLPESPTTFPPNVVVLRNWPHQAVMTAWRHSLAGIVPSIWPDPCPGVAMEAMATGRPVIAARIGGLPEIVADGETGILVAPGDADALRAAMARLIDDPALAARMGAAGRQRVTAFHASTVVGQIESVYQEVLV